MCTPRLGYTIDDDGVWLTCDFLSAMVADPYDKWFSKPCGFAKNLGHFPTVDDVIAAKGEHDQHAREHA